MFKVWELRILVKYQGLLGLLGWRMKIKRFEDLECGETSRSLGVIDL